MVRALLIRGMLVGLAAGMLAFCVAYVFGEPQVGRAIAFEEHLARMHHEPAEAELVSRGMQRTLGLLTGTVVMGVALGGLFSLVFAWAYGRIAPWSARRVSVTLALAAFCTITAVPSAKYPAAPPAVGNPETIDRRTVLFAVMIAISVLSAVAAARLRREVLPRLGGRAAAGVAVGTFVALVAVAGLMLPAVHEVPAGFPADVLWRFRLASLGTTFTLWAVIGAGFGVAAQRLLATRGGGERSLGESLEVRPVQGG